MNRSLNAQKQPLYFWQTIPQMKGLLNIKKTYPGETRSSAWQRAAKYVNTILLFSA
jgi:hypothetical protein